MAESSRGTRGTRAKRATVGSPDPQEHATRPKAQQKLGQCDLCETSLQPRKIYILKAEEVTGYNSLLAQVTGRNIPDTQHLIRKVWTASRCSSAKELSAGSKVCKVCWVTDNRRIQKLHETHDPMLLPRYWEKGEMATLGPGLKEQELCSVCMCSPEARNMLREGASTSAGSSQPALYSSSKYGSSMLSWFFQQLFPEHPVVFAGGKDLCSTHYQWFQKGSSLPRKYKDLIHARTGRDGWDGLSHRHCQLCGEHVPSDGKKVDGWQLVSGLSPAVRRKLVADNAEVVNDMQAHIGGAGDPTAGDDGLLKDFLTQRPKPHRMFQSSNCSLHATRSGSRIVCSCSNSSATCEW